MRNGVVLHFDRVDSNDIISALSSAYGQAYDMLNLLFHKAKEPNEGFFCLFICLSLLIHNKWQIL